jgi:hypothetical protein
MFSAKLSKNQFFTSGIQAKYKGENQMVSFLTILIIFVWIIFFLCLALNRNSQESTTSVNWMINAVMVVIFIGLLLATSFPARDYLEERSIVRYETQTYPIQQVYMSSERLSAIYEEDGTRKYANASKYGELDLKYIQGNSTVKVTRSLDRKDKVVRERYIFRIDLRRTHIYPYPGAARGSRKGGKPMAPGMTWRPRL